MGGSGARGFRVGLSGCCAQGAAPRRAGSGSPCQLGGAALVPPRPAGAGRADPPRSPERSAPRRLELGASPPLCRALACPPARSARPGLRSAIFASPAPALACPRPLADFLGKFAAFSRPPLAASPRPTSAKLWGSLAR